MSIQRYRYRPGLYSTSIQGFLPGMQPDGDGDWVQYRDVEPLLTEIQEIAEELGCHRAFILHTIRDLQEKADHKNH